MLIVFVVSFVVFKGLTIWPLVVLLSNIWISFFFVSTSSSYTEKHQRFKRNKEYDTGLKDSQMRFDEKQKTVTHVCKKTSQGIYKQILPVVTSAPQTVWRVLAGWRYKTTAARSTLTEPRWSQSAAPHWEPPGAAHVNPVRSVSSTCTCCLFFLC